MKDTLFARAHINKSCQDFYSVRNYKLDLIELIDRVLVSIVYMSTTSFLYKMTYIQCIKFLQLDMDRF